VTYAIVCSGTRNSSTGKSTASLVFPYSFCERAGGSAPPSSCDELTEIALKLRERVTLGPQQRYRLVGVGLSNFREPEQIDPQPVLFE
jgi:hypothetical protein